MVSLKKFPSRAQRISLFLLTFLPAYAAPASPVPSNSKLAGSGTASATPKPVGDSVVVGTPVVRCPSLRKTEEGPTKDRAAIEKVAAAAKKVALRLLLLPLCDSPTVMGSNSKIVMASSISESSLSQNTGSVEALNNPRMVPLSFGAIGLTSANDVTGPALIVAVVNANKVTVAKTLNSCFVLVDISVPYSSWSPDEKWLSPALLVLVFSSGDSGSPKTTAT